MARKAIRDLVEELRDWLPNFDRGADEYPTLLFRILASLPGGDQLEDLGYEPWNVGWMEFEQLGRVIDAIEDRRDVQDLIAGLLDENDDG